MRATDEREEKGAIEVKGERGKSAGIDESQLTEVIQLIRERKESGGKGEIAQTTTIAESQAL